MYSKKTQKLNREKGITLIALVITIVILIILATVAINMAFGDNGLIKMAKEAKDKTANSTRVEEDTIANIAEYMNGVVDGENESGVEITISKTSSILVTLKVESVEGIDDINLDKIDDEYIGKMSETAKKELIKSLYFTVNKIATEETGIDIENFEELLEIMDMTETEFWEGMETEVGKDAFLKMNIEALKEKGIKTVQGYKVINPIGKESVKYLVKEKGTYTFKVVDILEGKTYEKSVEINDDIVIYTDYTVKSTTGIVRLVDKDEKNAEFQKAYIFYNGETIDISDTITIEDNEYYIRPNDIASYMYDLDIINEAEELNGTKQIICLEKDGKTYAEECLLAWPS